jgi:iron complex outermembrane receptor protein
MISRKELYAGVAAIVTLSVMAPLGSTVAQTAQPAAPAAAPASGTDTTSGGLEEITVTAQRRTQNLQNVPLAVTSFTAGDLEAQQIKSTIDLGRVVPNMASSNNVGQGSANAYYIRGLGQTQSFPTFEPQVSTYIDDIYIGRQNANNFSLFDVSQIQVLNGPQGTLFGRNSTGGAIVVTLNKPSDEYTGYIEGSYGRFNRFSGRASIDIPISEQILTKTSVFGIADDGYVHDVTTGETLNAVHNFGVREAVRLLPASLDNVTWDLAGDYSRNDSANAWNTLSGSGDDRISYTGFSQKPGALAPYLTGDLANQGQGVVVQSWGFTSNIAAKFDAGTLNFITGYRGVTQQLAIDFSGTDGSVGPVLPSDTGPVGQFALVQALNDAEYTQEIKWSGTLGDSLTYTGGAYYLFELSKDHFGEVINIQALPNVNTPFPVDVTGADEFTQNNTSSKALYFQGDYKVTDQLTVTAGARYTDEVKDIPQAHPDQSGPGLGFTLADITQAGYAVRLKASEFTPHVSAQFQLTPDLMLFASATRGFQGGGWNGLTNMASAFNNFGPETIWSYEGGVRYQNPDHTLRFNSTFFYEDVQHYQLLSDIAGTSNFSTENSSDLIAYGLETQITYRPIDNLTLVSNIGLINAYYVNPISTVVAQQAACAASPGLQNGNCGNGIVNPIGGLATPDETPPITFAFNGSYNIDYPDFKVIPSVGIQWVARHFLTTSGIPHALQGAYYLLDLGVTVRLRNLPLEFTAECKDCTLVNYGTTDLYGKYYNDPGRWDIKATYSF